ncbi:MAG TPA: DNA polymerase I [Clostridiales bacterium]|nr:DNA polymerase I [Clostridiales bacterium]
MNIDIPQKKTDVMLLVDGNSLINREFYGVRPLSTKSGIPTNAVYGYLNVLAKYLADLSPDHAAVCFDLPAPTFRHKLYDGYKEGRRPMPDELAEQFPYVKRLTRLLGIPLVELEGWEADDGIGTLSRIGSENGLRVYILTGDRDSWQLIDDNTTVIYVSNKGPEEIGRAEFFERCAVQPEQYVDLKAVMGDSSDKIPGVRGVGAVTAPYLISEYKSLDGLYEAISDPDFSDPKITKSTLSKLRAGRDDAYLSYDLAKIDREAPLGLELGDVARAPADRKGLLEFCTELELNQFISRFGLLDAVPEINEPSEDKEYIPVAEEKAAARFAELDRKKLCGLWFSDDGLTFCAANEDERLKVEFYEPAGISAMKNFLESSERRFAVHDIKRLLHRFAPYGIRINANFDVMLAAYLLDSSDSGTDLSKLIGAHLGVPHKGEDAAAEILKLAEKQDRRMREEGSSGLYFEIEFPLAYLLFDMETAGFRVDTAGLAEYSEKLGALAAVYEENIQLMAGREFNPNSPKQLGETLFEHMKLPPPRGAKTKTGWSTAVDVLEKLADYHPIIDTVFDYRRVTKLKSTYCDGLYNVADENGLVHTNFNQTVTATGRLSSTEPNLQNIPIKTEQGRQLRKFFTARRKDRVLVDADYSQIELRLLAHIADDPVMIAAFNSGADIHASTASQVFGVPLSAVTPELRKRAKAVNFGIVYGIGGHSLGDDLGVSFREASNYIKRYLATFAGVDRYMKAVVEQAKEIGYVETLFGRRRYIPELKSPKFPLRKFGERVAMNSPIQGTAADIIKLAMVKTADALKKSGLDAELILQVHDELIVECAEKDAEDVKRLLKDCMENAVELKVPLTTEISVGYSWLDE